MFISVRQMYFFSWWGRPLMSTCLVHMCLTNPLDVNRLLVVHLLSRYAPISQRLRGFSKLKKSEKNSDVGGWVNPQLGFSLFWKNVFFLFFLCVVFMFPNLTRPPSKKLCDMVLHKYHWFVLKVVCDIINLYDGVCCQNNSKLEVRCFDLKLRMSDFYLLRYTCFSNVKTSTHSW